MLCRPTDQGTYGREAIAKRQRSSRRILGPDLNWCAMKRRAASIKRSLRASQQRWASRADHRRRAQGHDRRGRLPRHDAQDRRSGGRKRRNAALSFPRQEILFKVMEVLVANYRTTLAKQFAAPQKLHERIADLLRFIWSEIEKAPGEQLALQEMTLYVLRHPRAEHMAREKGPRVPAALRRLAARGDGRSPKGRAPDHGARQLHLHQLRWHAQPMAGGAGRRLVRTGDGEFNPSWPRTGRAKSPKIPY